jgi:hypothetical protein
MTRTVERSEWRKTTERLRLIAGKSEQAGCIIPSIQPNPSIEELAALETASFSKGIPLLGIPARPVKIPYEKTTFPGYFFRSHVAGGKASVLIVHQGRDATGGGLP